MDPPKVRTAPWWVKVLVLWHVFCITVWACPKPSDAIMNGQIKPGPFAVGDWLRYYDQTELKPALPIQDYLFTFGTWQYWDMFSPDPAYIDWFGDVIIKYKDGTQKVVEYPRMYHLSIPQKYVMERFRKFYERAHDPDNYPYFFPPFCYRQALENYTDPKNPPVQVTLRRNYRYVNPPDQIQDKDFHSFVYFIYEIDPAVLNQIKDGPP